MLRLTPASEEVVELEAAASGHGDRLAAALERAELGVQLVRDLIEENAYCPDVLGAVADVQRAIDEASVALLRAELTAVDDKCGDAVVTVAGQLLRRG